MVSWLISRMVVLAFGTLYPAYSSYKAVKTKNVKEYVKWMMYWIVFALFSTAETITDMLLSWFPFYFELKIAFVIWLLSPYTKGSSVLYRKFVHPTLSNKEKEIDEYITQAKDRSYETMMRFGKRGLNIAATAAVTAAAKYVPQQSNLRLNLRQVPALTATNQMPGLSTRMRTLLIKHPSEQPASEQPRKQPLLKQRYTCFFTHSLKKMHCNVSSVRRYAGILCVCVCVDTLSHTLTHTYSNEFMKRVLTVMENWCQHEHLWTSIFRDFAAGKAANQHSALSHNI
uniref:Receptor expression-enhancing protein n=1 Tax=Astyanax mexicanus TaxID=7994 RepID=A0A3B1JRI5_ASTMX